MKDRKKLFTHTILDAFLNFPPRGHVEKQDFLKIFEKCEEKEVEEKTFQRRE